MILTKFKIMNQAQSAFIVILSFVFWLTPTSLLAVNSEINNCLQAKQATLKKAVNKQDFNTMLDVLDQCLVDNEDSKQDEQLKKLWHIKIMARTTVLLSLLNGTTQANTTELDKKQIEKNLDFLLSDINGFKPEDFKDNERLLIQSLGLKLFKERYYKAAQELTWIGGLSFIDNKNQETFLKVLLLHINASAPALKANSAELRRLAIQLHNTLNNAEEHNTLSTLLSIYYGEIGDMQRAYAFAGLAFNPDEFSPCFTPQSAYLLLKLRLTDKEAFTKLVSDYKALKQNFGTKKQIDTYNINALSLEQEKELFGEYGLLQCLEPQLQAYQALAKYDFSLALKILNKELTRRDKIFGDNSACSQEMRLMLASTLKNLSDEQGAKTQLSIILNKPASNYFYLSALSEHASLMLLSGNYKAAEQSAQTIMRIAKEQNLKDVAGLGAGILAYIYWTYDLPAQAIEYTNLANQTIFSKKDTSSGLNSLRCMLLLFEKKYPEALTLAEELIKEEMLVMGPKHVPINHLWKKIYPLIMLKRNAEATDLFVQLLSAQTPIIINTLPLLSDEQSELFINKNKGSLAFGLDFVTHTNSENLTTLENTYDIWLKRKGLLLEVQSRIQTPQFSNLPNDIQQKRKQLDELRVQLNTAKQKSLFTPLELAELESKMQNIERNLVKLLPSLLTIEELNKINLKALIKTLPKDTVLIDFALALDTETLLKNKQMNPNIFDLKNQRDLPYVYLAFIIKNSEKDNFSIVRLGSAKNIDTAIYAFRHSILRSPGKKGQNIRKAGADLNMILFAPLRPYLNDAKTIYVSPDGELNSLAFETIPDKHDSWLIDHYTFQYLTTPRDLLFTRNFENDGSSLIIGNPDFSCTEENSQENKTLLNISRDLRQTLEDNLNALHFSPLDGTQEEIQAVQVFSGSNSLLYTRCTAQKARLFEHKLAPKHIHLATHGFFLNDDSFDSLGGNTAMLQSGLVFAGINNTQTKSKNILFAEEIVGLDLRGTELAVLSACQTGLGEVKNGEGVYGLRRAFALAGVKNLVMSLWSVPDKETGQMMQAFYANLYSGDNVSVALHKAMLSQKQKNIEKYGYANPLYWGGFICVGTGLN